MKCLRRKTKEGKNQAFTASMKTHIHLQPDASATIVLTCPLPLAEGFSPLFGSAVKETVSSPTHSEK